MALSPQYVLGPSLQEYFVDKDTGLPLTAGIVEFFSDDDKITKKPVFVLTFTGSDYVFVELPNPMILSSVGTFQYLGNDIVPYYFPYDEDGNLQLYYITVKNSEEEEQFVRYAWPNIVSSSTVDVQTFVNYVPNPQFLEHNYIIYDPVTEDPGQINQPITIIAPGGWSFERDAGSTAVDLVTFIQQTPAPDGLTGNPRYVLQVENTNVGSGNTFKSVALKFPDVNMFANDDNIFTFSFMCQTIITAPVDIDLYMIHDYGTGGAPSATTETFLKTFTVTPINTWEMLSTTVNFPDNSGKSLGTNGNDFVQLALRLPTGANFQLQFVNFILTANPVTIVAFPATTNAECISQTIAGWSSISAYDNSDLYLPPMRTPQGLTYDRSQIGKIYASSYATPLSIGELDCDGAQYETAGYSTDLIPYARLQEKLYNSTLNIPVWGTGPQYITAFNVQTNEFLIHTNTAGAFTAAVDGALTTGFTFQNVGVGATTYYTSSAWFPTTAATEFSLQNNFVGTVTAVTAGDSTFGVSTIRSSATPVLQQITLLGVTTTSLAGKYFTFQSYNAGTHSFYVWFKVDGSGSDPAPGGTGILVNLTASDTTSTIAHKISNVLNGWTVTSIKTVAGSSVTAGHYFTVSSSAANYYVWYKVNGAGTDPALANKIGIEVDILSTDTSTQVAQKTQVAINSKYFSVPDFRGLMLKDYRNSSPSSSFRYSFIDGIDQGFASDQYDFFLSHNHAYGTFTQAAATAAGAETVAVNSATELTQYSGSPENIVRNAGIKWIIKY